MQAITQLTNWLNSSNKDYDEGIAIYNEYGFSRILKNLFAKGPNAYNTEKLKSELQNILPRLEKDQDKIIRTKTVQKEITKSSEKANNHPENRNTSPVKRYSEIKVPGYEFKNLPEKLKYEWQLRIDLFKQAEAHHYRLDSLETKEERKAAVEIILTNFIQIDKYWARLDYWGKNGFILPEVDEIKTQSIKEYTDPIEMLKKRNNLRANLSKAKKRLFTLKDNNKIADLQQKIAKWEIEKDDLENKLAANG